MKYIKIDPPGTFCFNDAFLNLVKKIKAKKFLEIGCGEGEISNKLLKKGYYGTGIDFSKIAVEKAIKKNNYYIEEGRYKVFLSNIFENNNNIDCDFDFIISFCVMEHLKEDNEFLKIIKSKLKDNGYIFISVPARKSKWSIEDDTAGHVKRYEKNELFELLNNSGYKNIKIISVGVPISNLLLNVSNFFILKSSERNKKELSKEEQTKLSGIREIPFKTIFPIFFKIFFNKITLLPFLIIQRFFFKSNLGLVMLIQAQK